MMAGNGWLEDGWENKPFSIALNKRQYFENGRRYSQKLLFIGSRICAFDWQQDRWIWM